MHLDAGRHHPTDRPTLHQSVNLELESTQTTLLIGHFHVGITPADPIESCKPVLSLTCLALVERLVKTIEGLPLERF